MNCTAWSRTRNCGSPRCTPTPTACSTSPVSTTSCPTGPSARPGPAGPRVCSTPPKSTGASTASQSACTPNASAPPSSSPAMAARSRSAPPARPSTRTAPRRCWTSARKPACSCPPGAAWASASAASRRSRRAPSATCAPARSPRPSRASSSRPACPPRRAPATSNGRSTLTAIAPTAHLTAEQIEELGRELDAIRDEVIAGRGEKDAAYIRKVISAQRKLELVSRGVLLFSIFPPAWLLGTAGLSVAKIMDNMEIGHNVLHGQWDWMRDPKIHSTSWEWDHVSPAEQGKHSHNELHHTYTNVIGKDNDLGYGIMRVDEDQKWHPFHLGQPLWNFLNACFFEYGIAAYDLELAKNLDKRRRKTPEFRARAKAVGRKIRKQVLKDYVIHPLLSGPSFLHTLAATFTANLVRNIWSHSVIMCGHFPEGVQVFERRSIKGETRGQWYLRQMMGSANISGSKAMHFMTGNLSHQIEHHLFPDLPSNRYAEVPVKVRALFEKYELEYVTGSLPRQVGSAWKKVIRLSLPNKKPKVNTPERERELIAA